LIPSETSYVARTPSRQTLRFSKSGSPTIERLCRSSSIRFYCSTVRKPNIGGFMTS
jgi:hypothetical protein